MSHQLKIIFFALFLSLKAYSADKKIQVLSIDWNLLATYQENKGKKVEIKPELKSVLGKEVKITGFMMPLDFSSKKIKEFLFMPYIPSCSHVPPPPSNQIVLVKMTKGKEIDPSFYPVSVSGILKLEKNKDIDSTFLLEAKNVIEEKK